MKNTIHKTADNSKTLYSEMFDEHYHSVLGAITESMHIFVKLGLSNFKNDTINILEIGFGTGLNAMLSYAENKSLQNQIYYHGIDLYPPESKTISKLDYSDLINLNNSEFESFCKDWDTEIAVSDAFHLCKQKINFLDFSSQKKYNLVYFDAFSPEKQPEMWTASRIKSIYEMMSDNGILVTYCSKGEVKRTLREIGFIVKRLQGPPGKWHVLKAIKS
jgi:tRNA U34 5-methylaminomethyl-2-thiouridine-forming methyltransferase MnmC